MEERSSTVSEEDFEDSDESFDGEEEEEKANAPEAQVVLGIPRKIPIEVSEQYGVAEEETSAELVEDKTSEEFDEIDAQGDDNDVIEGSFVRKSSVQASLDDIADIPIESEAGSIQLDDAESKTGGEEGGLITEPIQESLQSSEVIDIPISVAPLSKADMIEIPIMELESESSTKVSESSVNSDASVDVPVTQLEPQAIEFISIPVQVIEEEERPTIMEAELAEGLKSKRVPEIGKAEQNVAEKVEPTKKADEMKIIEIGDTPEEADIDSEKNVAFREQAEQAKTQEPEEKKVGFRDVVVVEEPYRGTYAEEGYADEVPRKKSRDELIEEVRRDLQLQWDARGTFTQAPLERAPPSHVTFSSRAPPNFHAPFFKSLSAQANSESIIRNEHTIDYVYVPPQMDHLREFDDMVKVGPHSIGLWSTERALARSRSLEKRRPWVTTEGYGPAPLRSVRSVQPGLTHSVPVTRSSSYSNLRDYVNATRKELRRSRSRSRFDDYTGEYYYNRPDQPLVSSELLNDPPVFERMALRTQNYVSTLHKPYESTVPSYYGTYFGKPPYCPYVVASHYDHLYPRDSYVKRRLNRWMEDVALPHGVRSIYESYMNELENGVLQERGRRSRLEREAFYADRELDFARKSIVQAKNAASALEFERFMSDTEHVRPKHSRPTYSMRPPVHSRRYYYPYA